MITADIVTLVTFGLAVATEVLVDVVMRRHRQPGGDARDDGSFWLLNVVVFGGYIAATFVALANPGGIDVRTASGWAWVGLASVIAGGTLRVWSVGILGAYFTRDVRVFSEHAVVSTGPYRLVRHPAYTGFLLVGLGVALSLRSVSALLLLPLPELLVVSWRVHIEERALASTLGEPYRAYMRSSWRFIPHVL
jgi:protein-S-isoprenylcysteine O-methyltransferase